MKTLQKYITEGQKKTIKMKLSKFLSWYLGETVRKVTADKLYDDFVWDYLEDDLNMPLKDVADLFNANLRNEIEFNQEDLGNTINIKFELDGKEISVDSTDWIGTKFD